MPKHSQHHQTTATPPNGHQYFDPTSNYCIVYEEVLNNREARKIFHEFLEEHRNDAPLMFIDSIADYQQSYETVLKEVFGGWKDEEKLKRSAALSNSKQNKQMFRNEVIGKVECLMSVYIELNSEHELNIGTNQRTLLKNWKSVHDELIQNYLNMTTTTRDSSSDNIASSRLSYCVSSGSYLSVEQIESAIMLKLEPMTLFGFVLSVIHLDLKMDQFSRFVRSEKLNTFLKHKGESFTRSIGYDISKGYKVDLRFKPKDLREQVINDDHIYFGFTLAEDTPDWKLIYNRKDLCCYSSNTTYFFGESKRMKLLKAVMYLPFSFEDVVAMIYNSDNHDSFDPQTRDGFVLQSYRPPSGLNNAIVGDGLSSYATQCLSISVDLSMPLIKKRHLRSVATTISETDLLFQVLHTADFTNEQMPINKDLVKAHSLSYYLVYRVSNQLTRVVHVTYSDVCLPFQTNFLFEIFWKKRAKALFDGFTKMLNLITNNGTSHADLRNITDSHKHKQAVEDNSRVFPNRSWYKEWLERSRRNNSESIL